MSIPAVAMALCLVACGQMRCCLQQCCVSRPETQAPSVLITALAVPRLPLLAAGSFQEPAAAADQGKLMWRWSAETGAQMMR